MPTHAASRWPLASRPVFTRALESTLKLKRGLRRSTPVPSSSPTSTVLFWTGDTPHPAAVGGCVVGTWEIAPTSANATLIQEPQPCRLTSLSDGDTIRSLGAPLPHFRSPSCTLYTTLAPCRRDRILRGGHKQPTTKHRSTSAVAHGDIREAAWRGGGASPSAPRQRSLLPGCPDASPPAGTEPPASPAPGPQHNLGTGKRVLSLSLRKFIKTCPCFLLWELRSGEVVYIQIKSHR